MTIKTWDSTKPVGTDSATIIDDELRGIKKSVEDSFPGFRDGLAGTDDVMASTGPQVDSAVATAGTALQPGADVSLLTNDSNYQTDTEVDTTVDASVTAAISAHEADAADPHSAAGYQDVAGVTNIAVAVVGVHNTGAGRHTTQFAGKSDVDHTHTESDITDLGTYQPTSEKGNANGYAELDGTGKVPASQLPAASGGTNTYGGEINSDGSWNSTPPSGFGTGNTRTGPGEYTIVHNLGSNTEIIIVPTTTVSSRYAHKSGAGSSSVNVTTRLRTDNSASDAGFTFVIVDNS